MGPTRQPLHHPASTIAEKRNLRMLTYCMCERMVTQQTSAGRTLARLEPAIFGTCMKMERGGGGPHALTPTSNHPLTHPTATGPIAPDRCEEGGRQMGRGAG